MVPHSLRHFFWSCVRPFNIYSLYLNTLWKGRADFQVKILPRGVSWLLSPPYCCANPLLCLNCFKNDCPWTLRHCVCGSVFIPFLLGGFQVPPWLSELYLPSRAQPRASLVVLPLLQAALARTVQNSGGKESRLGASLSGFEICSATC